MYTIDKPSLDELAHFGILGMKWGTHKQKEAAYRDKLSAISKNKRIKGTSDVKRFEMRNQSLTNRIRKRASSEVFQMLVGDALSGNLLKYSKMSKPELIKALTKKAITLTATTAANVAIDDALAKSASKRYTDDGKSVGIDVKKGRKTKEDRIQQGVSAAVTVAPLVSWALKTKMYKAKSQRVKNEMNFRKWGKNILPEKVDNIV